MLVSGSAPTTMRSAALSVAVARSALAGSPSTSRAAEMVADSLLGYPARCLLVGDRGAGIGSSPVPRPFWGRSQARNTAGLGPSP